MDAIVTICRILSFILLVTDTFVNSEVSETLKPKQGLASFNTCHSNKCSEDGDILCLNGGLCIFDPDSCLNSCACASGFSGSRCEFLELPETQPEPRKKVKFARDEFVDMETVDTSTTSSVIITPDPRYNVCRDTAFERTVEERTCSRTFVCQYGVCEKTLEETNGWMGWKYDCLCDLGSVGLLCEHRCCLDCGEHGTCDVHNNTKYCSCQHHYKGDNCSIFVPVPVKIEIREVTWYLWVVGVCATAFLMLIILSAVLPYYMWKHRVILIMKIVHYFQPYEDDDEKQWDAFVSYKADQTDEHFVVHNLYPKLEKELGFKLCLHFRDFVPGETIANNIINAVESSRRTILILSPRYIQSEFTRFEYQKAQTEMLKRKHKIIPILLEDITSVKPKMDKNLKGIIDSVTYLEWPGSRSENDKKIEKFWKRLTLSLPKKKDSLTVSSSSVSPSSVTISSQVTLYDSSNISSSWVPSDNVKTSDSLTSESIYCDIKSVDEKLNLNISGIPTLSEKEEEEMIENFKNSQKNWDKTEMVLSGKRLQSQVSYSQSEVSSPTDSLVPLWKRQQSQVSYSQSEVSSPTDSLTPLWINKADDITEDQEQEKGLHKYLELLDAITEV